MQQATAYFFLGRSRKKGCFLSVDWLDRSTTAKGQLGLEKKCRSEPIKGKKGRAEPSLY